MSLIKEKLIQLRKEKGYTPCEVAKLLGIRHDVYVSHEEGRRPGHETLIKIAKLYNVSLDYLFGITPVKKYDHDKEVDYLMDSLLSMLNDLEDIETLIEDKITNLNEKTTE